MILLTELYIDNLEHYSTASVHCLPFIIKANLRWGQVHLSVCSNQKQTDLNRKTWWCYHDCFMEDLRPSQNKETTDHKQCFQPWLYRHSAFSYFSFCGTRMKMFWRFQNIGIWDCKLKIKNTKALLKVS